MLIILEWSHIGVQRGHYNSQLGICVLKTDSSHRDWPASSCRTLSSRVVRCRTYIPRWSGSTSTPRPPFSFDSSSQDLWANVSLGRILDALRVVVSTLTLLKAVVVTARPTAEANAYSAGNVLELTR